MSSRHERYEVVLTRGAEQDLESIYNYIAEFDCVENANRVLDRLTSAAQGLAQFPARGSCLNELGALGIKAYRQVWFKPYKLIYRVLGDQVVVYMIVDSRRDLQAMLVRRLLCG
jgi:toxin ParE1/3/4